MGPDPRGTVAADLPGLVVLDRLPSATLSELGTWLRRSETHVVHFVGHGDFDQGLREGVIYFQDQAGRRSAVTSSTLGPYLRDHDPLRMVVLNACRSARTDTVDPFGGMAQGLVQQDATAVVAMQFPISDRAAVKFTGEFYGALVDGQPVDQAVSSARKSLLDGFQDEWATPVLFLRSPDGNIFENVHAAPGVVPPGPDEVRPDPPGPSFWKSAVRWSSAATASWCSALPREWSSRSSSRSWSSSSSWVTTTYPSPACVLPDAQLLVAAGDSADELHVFRFDATTGEEGPKSLTTGDHERVQPRAEPGPDHDDLLAQTCCRATSCALWRINGEGDRPLFDESSLTECSESTGRPAWIPGTDDLVMRCFGSDGFIRMVGLDIHGNFKDTYDEIEPGRQVAGLRPPDGLARRHHRRVPHRRRAEVQGRHPVRDRPGDAPARVCCSRRRGSTPPTATPCSRPRATCSCGGPPRSCPRVPTRPTDLGSEVLAAPLRRRRARHGQPDPRLRRRRRRRPGPDVLPRRDADRLHPLAPDDPATEVVEPDVIRELWIASVADPDDRRKLSGDAHTFYSVPGLVPPLSRLRVRGGGEPGTVSGAQNRWPGSPLAHARLPGS